MKLLLDQNLSPHLIPLLKVDFSNSIHVQSIGLGKALDSEIWNYAKENNLTVVSKDADFTERSLIFGFPPKVIWIRRGNCSTADIKNMLSNNFSIIQKFYQDSSTGIISLY